MTTTSVLSFFQSLTPRDIALFCAFFVPFINLHAFWCQIAKSHRLNTAVGISAIMLMMRYAAAISQITYLNMLDTPLLYRTMVMPQWALIVVMVWQQVYYAPDPVERWGVAGTFVALMCAWFAAIAYGLAGNAELVGNFAGWLLFWICTCIQVPQIYWNWRRRSVHGYSLRFVVFSMTAISIDFLLAHIIGLPIQTYWVYTGALIYRGIELLQFWLYPHTGPDGEVDLEDRLYTG